MRALNTGSMELMPMSLQPFTIRGGGLCDEDTQTPGEVSATFFER